jgi:regulator of replication initiation timing
MAKALIGHVGGPDPRLILELRRLQERVRHLETENLRLRAENDTLTSGLDDPGIIALEVKEPALA